MDTVGGLIDKLITVNLKIRHSADPGSLPDLLKQKDHLTQELDALVCDMIEASKSGESLDNGAFIQRKHKTC